MATRKISKPIIKTIEISAGVNPDYLEETLTTDISVLESLFDLIDNSIDAARDHLLTRTFERDKYGLPNDYSGYNITIRLGKKNISILDNCLGIEESTLTNKVFMTAGTSNHKFGIGHYGLGLKRALLKFGSTYAMSSDDGEIAFKMRFDGQMISGNKTLTANAYKTSGHRKTLFVVSDIKPSIAYEIENKSWFENAIKMLKTRYAVYTAKGLKISIVNLYHHEWVAINGILPSIRVDSKFHPISKPLNVEGVDVYVDSGIHGEYYFPTEGKYSLTKNRTITDDFGLYFICNDRVIVASSTASEYGWKTKWHSEYNGFVCIVRFVSEDSSKMPWNTLKTALKTDGRLFVQVREQLQPIADSYRQSVKKLYLTPAVKDAVQENTRNSTNTSTVKNNNPPSTIKNDSPKVSVKLKAADMAGNNQHLHVKNWDTLLPSEFPRSENAVLNAFIIDALNLNCQDAPSASALLLRAILEKSLREFVSRSKSFEEVKAHFYDTAEGRKKEHTEAQKKKQGIDLSMMLAWLKDETAALKIFGTEKKPILWVAAKKASTHSQKLNGVVHGLELIDVQQVKTIRNEIYQLLNFCVLNATKKVAR